MVVIIGVETCIDVRDDTGTFSKDQLKIVSDLLEFASKKEGLKSSWEVAVTIVSALEIQNLNNLYRNKDVATDVLSFPMEEEEFWEVPDDKVLVLGDIIISAVHVKKQAEEYNHGVERELGFLALHGFLHLLGYDHLEGDEEKVMNMRQETILSQYGLIRNGVENNEL